MEFPTQNNKVRLQVQLVPLKGLVVGPPVKNVGLYDARATLLHPEVG